MAPHAQEDAHKLSLGNPQDFWRRQSDKLTWHRRPSQSFLQTTKNLLSGVSHPHFAWFPNGEISTCYNCVDRHVEAGNGALTAIIWDSPVTGSKERFTYNQLLSEVETLAGVLREEGVKKGDVVLVYSACYGSSLEIYVDAL